MAVVNFPLPDVGEGLTEAEIVQWRVKVGDTVAINDILVEIETAKSLVELPSPFAGTIVALMAAEGDTVPVGTPIIQVDSEGGVPAPLHPAPEPASAAAPTAKSEPAAEPVLVGYGSTGHVSSRRGNRVAPVAASAATLPPVAGVPAAGTPVLAKPPIRKMAKELGVDLASVIATPLAAAVERYERIDAFIVVPTSWKSWRLRGFHPMKLILRMLDIRSTVVIRRRRRAHDQRGLTVDERIANLTGAFEGSPRCRGRLFMLIDDVVTSGATVAEVIRAVRAAGGEVVCVVALAHVALRRHAEKY